jgi:MoxR-like ATPase
MAHPVPGSIEETQSLLASGGYIAGRDTATVLFLALKLKRPLFVEGEPGTGKTEIAKVLSATLGRPLIRLQCYEGLDQSSAVYEWNYAAQMTAIRLAEATHSADIGKDIYSERFLIRRPLLQALQPGSAGPCILLIDELDRVDEPFEAFLLEVLSDFQVTIPEIGVIKAPEPPIVIITSNRTREVHDAVKRRCLYHWVDYPTAERELQIVRSKVPGVPEKLSQQVVTFVQSLRSSGIFKPPGLAETLDWAQALVALDALALSPELTQSTLGVLLKYQDDISKFSRQDIEQRVLSAQTAAE